MIYITGDTHGDRFRLYNPCLETLGHEDILIICGDFGFIFDNEKTEQEDKFLDWIENSLPFNLAFIDGNHENFDRLCNYPIEEWNGGKVHKIRPSIIHLMRGQVFSLPNDKTSISLFTMGGGYSVDRSLRGQGYWWKEELPNDNEYSEAISNLKKHYMSVDVIISHTAPLDTCVRMGIKMDSHEQTLNSFLQYISEAVSYKNWFFGHFHKDEIIWRGQRCIHYEIRELLSDNLFWRPIL